MLEAVTVNYYDLTFAREQINVEKAAMDLASELLAFTRRKVEAGALTMLDQQRTESGLETIRTALFASANAPTTSTSWSCSSSRDNRPSASCSSSTIRTRTFTKPCREE